MSYLEVIVNQAAKPKGQHKTTPSFDTWVDSIGTMLDCVDEERVQACSISVVPEQLRSSKVEAYRPKVVSIGPLHRGTARDLLYMEEIKWRCMRYLLNRSEEEKGEQEQEQNLEEKNLSSEERIEQEQEQEQSLEEKNLRKCSIAILMLDELVRASYNVDDIKFNSKALAKIMVLDGCFLLELLICGSKELNEKLRYDEKCSSPGIEVRKKENVLLDLTLLENQIPILIVNFLFEILFPTVFEKMGGEHNIKILALSLLGYNSKRVEIQRKFYGFHFLELVHSFTDKEVESQQDKEVESQQLLNMAASEEDMDISYEKLELKRCVSRLEAAGVKINPTGKESESWKMTINTKMVLNFIRILVGQLLWLLKKVRPKKRHESHRDPDPEDIRFDLKITFKDGILKIPTLHITKTTEAKWRNLIAWELNRTDQERLIDPNGEARINCKFISYAFFFQNLICCVHDVQLLQDRNVIKVHEVKRNNKGKIKVMSNQELVDFFSRITQGVPDDQNYMDTSFRKLFLDLNAHKSTSNYATESGKFAWHYLRRFVTWIWVFCRIAIWVLIRDHIPTGWKFIAVLAVAAGLALTAVQTAYSVISVKNQ